MAYGDALWLVVLACGVAAAALGFLPTDATSQAAGVIEECQMMPAFIAALSALLGVLVFDTRPGFSSASP